MNYQETLDYLFSQLPMFQRIGSAAYKANLDNTFAICQLLQHPEKKFRSIHIAGTNGKGSTSHYLAAILQQAGYKTGLYTSPHLLDFRERIKINGAPVSQEFVVEFVKKNKTAFLTIQPSFFEMTVGLALEYFALEKVDIAIIETGMGGRLDSTNVIQPLMSIITNISLDHVAFLGNNVAAIAKEKAGIIKAETPVIIGETQEKIRTVFVKKAKALNAPLVFADQRFQAKNPHYIKNSRLLLSMDVETHDGLVFDGLETELLGLYQQKNIPTVFAAVEVLKNKQFKISDADLRAGIKNVVSLTNLLGRWQVLSKKPLMIADIAHNEAGINEVVKQLTQTPHQQLHFVLGVVNDKDISGILSLLPQNASYYFCNAAIPRALQADKLKNMAALYGLSGRAFSSVKEAKKSAAAAANKDDLILIGGSAFTVSEALS